MGVAIRGSAALLALLYRLILLISAIVVFIDITGAIGSVIA